MALQDELFEEATATPDELQFGAERCVSSRAKRLVDLGFSLAGVVLLSPFLATMALAIFVQDRGPVFFRQERSGLNGEVFKIWKFRTMRQPDGDLSFRQTSDKADARITRLGRWMRALSLDELPQLLNIIQGDMSIVGPRPHPVELDAALAGKVRGYQKRQLVRPGLTGIAQINGSRGPIKSSADMQVRLRHDLMYIRAWNLMGDAGIVFKTLLCSKAFRNAY